MTDFYGKTIAGVDGLERGSDSVVITFEDGCSLHMWHSQDCCESVSIEDIDSSAGSLDGAVFHDLEVYTKEGNSDWGAETYTFYTLKTDRGYVWIRWFGESNGYYSTGVSTKYCEAGESRGWW
ncbi:hypothetical protein QGX11_gp125 [Pseudomonas phage PPSC2]|uniref:DUF7448 domain-containing protein n=1 Tax=Pseudomonas phage PPSC2 TaxID=2041350 RepID=A0A2R2YAT7_9CAUD|nr:hypothetical protein QGX11_gp125 [Pseudomonas phage PPSC2]ATN92888.1 hypothetical protein PPSC2_125 [Pseudomonas phage PPSC2]